MQRSSGRRSLIVVGMLAGALVSANAAAATDWDTGHYDLYPGDFDGDGRTDLLHVAKDPSKMSGIALSDGTGPNLSAQSWPSNHLGIPWHSNLYNVIVADFNGDGRTDVLLQRTTPGDHYLLQTAANGALIGIAQTISNTALGLTWSADQHKLLAGDFNGDGRADLFLQATSPTGTHAVVLADSGGRFTSAPTQSWTDASWGSFKWSARNATIYVGDFNGDTRADLLVQAKPTIVLIDYDVSIPVPTYSPNSFGVVLSAGGYTPFGLSGVQQWSRHSHGADWAPSAAHIVVGDFDHNGRADVILQARSAGRPSYLVSGNASGAAFSAAATLASNVTWSADSYRLVAGNFDGSGGAGIYYQSTSSSGSNYYANSVNGGSVSQSSHPVAAGPAPATAVGRTVGEASVGHMGEAKYSIPLWTPPGTNQLAPSVRLEYTSEGPNGWFGMGWSIPALSRISRCPRTVAQDGTTTTTAGPFSSEDRFCIDGARLRLVGSGTYGVAGTSYRTELETYRDIRIVAADSYGPTWFQVRTANGLTYEYGNTSDSKIRLLTTSSTLSSVRLYWALNRIIDRSGNYVDFTYTQDTTHGGYYPHEIRWTGNTGGAAPAYKVVFVKDSTNRPDPIWSELPYAGSGIRRQFHYYQRLSRIEVYATANNRLLRRYQLLYAPPVPGSLHSTSLLESVQECGLDASTCFAPTRLTWLTSAFSRIATQTSQATSNDLTVIDINGDACDDIVWPASTWTYMLSNCAGGFTSAQSTGISVGSHGAHVLDWDGDGIQDLAVMHTGGRWWILPGGAGGFGTPIDTSVTANVAGFIDVNGDGRRDLIQKAFGGLAVRLRSGSSFSAPVIFETLYEVGSIVPADPRRRQDFDGDGYEDLVYFVDEIDPDYGWITPALQISHGAGTTLRSGVYSLYNYSKFKGVGDFNGDQIADYAEASGTTLRNNLGGSIPLINPAWPALVADWDGDGSDDVLIATGSSGTPWSVYRSNGTGGFGVAETTSLVGTAAVKGDFDGDGATDVLVSNGASLQMVRHSGGSSAAIQDVLHKATDGFGVTAEFSYGLLSDANVHAPGSGAGWPLSRVGKPKAVVKQLFRSDGTGSTATYALTFQYEGAREDVSGRGFVGFSKRTIYDSRTPALRSEETHHQSFPHIGLSATTSLRQHPSGTVVRSKTNTWSSLSLTGGESRAYPYVSQSSESRRELGGPADGQQFASVVMTVNAIDSVSGVVTDRSVVTTEAGSTGLSPGATYTQRTYYPALSNDTTSWCLGRPTRVQQINSHSLADGASITRTTDLAWNMTSCRLQRETVEPGDTRWQVQTEYGYDSFGNIDLVTITPAANQGQAVRVSSTYWGTDGRFPRTMTNAKSQVTVLGWDTTLAVRTSVTDPNGVSESWSYLDGFARVTGRTYTDGTSTDYEQGWCNTLGCRGSEVNRRTYVLAVNKDSTTARNETGRSYHYFDQFDREVSAHTRVLGGGYSSVRRTFDASGRLWQESVPYLSGDPLWYTSYTYDALGRLVQTSRPTSEADPGASLTTRTFSGLTVITADALSRPTTIKLNPLGQRVQTIDALGKDVDYSYDAFGNLVRTRDVAGNEIVLGYNVRGMKMSSSDPDMGAWAYDYYPLGELRWQQDAKLQQTSFEYDQLSRLTRRIETEGDTFWYWDTQANGIGKLASVTSPGSYSEVYNYDSRGRLWRTTVNADGSAYDVDQSYDDAGLISTLTYPQSTGSQRFRIKYGYQYGMMQSIQEYTGGVSGTTLWQANAVNARGQIIDEQTSNTLRTISGYDRIAGWLDDRTVGPGGGAQRHNFAYRYDRVGNLQQRRDLNQSLQEDFTYDALDRLDVVQLNGNPTLDVDYDALGNITSKTGVGQYTYHPTKKHAVTAAGSNTYTYDDNGNLASRNGASITWSSYNQPLLINQAGGNSSQFAYGADRSRYKHVANFGSYSETTISIKGIFDRVTRGSVTEYRHTVVGPEGPLLVHTRRTAGTASDFYFFSKDHLASISLVTTSSGASLVQSSFDAFGARRNGATWTGTPTASDLSEIANVGRRGFTDHEHVDNLDLIHMNGRAYDPAIGRFLSADPFVQAPFHGQSLNRYSYVFNNPLKYVDPSGFLCADLIAQVTEDGGNYLVTGIPMQTCPYRDALDEHGISLFGLFDSEGRGRGRSGDGNGNVWSPLTATGPSDSHACAKIGACGSRGEVSLQTALRGRDSWWTRRRWNPSS